MKGYFYTHETCEFAGETDLRVDPGEARLNARRAVTKDPLDPVQPVKYLLPGHATLIEPPLLDSDELACFNCETKIWEIKTKFTGLIYLKRDGSSKSVDCLPACIPDEFTQIEPDENHSYFDDITQTWILDKKRKFFAETKTFAVAAFEGFEGATFRGSVENIESIKAKRDIAIDQGKTTLGLWDSSGNFHGGLTLTEVDNIIEKLYDNWTAQEQLYLI